MAETFEECKENPECESNFCSKNANDPSCGATMTFPECGGNSECNALYTKSCQEKPELEHCKTATISPATSPYPGCDPNDSTCINECNEKPSLEQCKNSTTPTSSGTISPPQQAESSTSTPTTQPEPERLKKQLMFMIQTYLTHHQQLISAMEFLLA